VSQSTDLVCPHCMLYRTVKKPDSTTLRNTTEMKNSKNDED